MQWNVLSGEEPNFLKYGLDPEFSTVNSENTHTEAQKVILGWLRYCLCDKSRSQLECFKSHIWSTARRNELNSAILHLFEWSTMFPIDTWKIKEHFSSESLKYNLFHTFRSSSISSYFFHSISFSSRFSHGTWRNRRWHQSKLLQGSPDSPKPTVRYNAKVCPEVSFQWDMLQW